MTDLTIEKAQAFVAKWCPPGRAREFMEDFENLLKTAVTEATDYMITGRQ